MSSQGSNKTDKGAYAGVMYTSGTVMLVFFRYTKLGFAGNTEPQFIIPSCELVHTPHTVPKLTQPH